MTEKRSDGGSERGDGFAAFGFSRRDVMRATGASILAGSALPGVASAQGSTCRDHPALENCTFKHKYEQDSLEKGLTCDCSPTADPSGCITFANGQRCISITTSALSFFDASHVTLKTGSFCQAIPVSEGTLETVSLSCGTVEVRTFCSQETDDGKIHDVSHVEIFGCPTADATVDCPNDRAVVDAANTDSVYWTVDYEHCDAPDEDGTHAFPDASGGTFSVPLANCEGTLSVFTAAGGELLDRVHFDCETAGVSVDCPNDVATISAPDTDEVWYEVDYVHCDEADVSRTMVDLGSTDSVTVPIADCEGTITLTDDDGRVLDSAAFDCETAGVSVECPPGLGHPVATISAADTSTVDFSVDYAGGCTDSSGSVDLSGSTDTVELALQNCDGTITLTDDDGNVLDSAAFERCCPPCPDALSVKFEEKEIEVGATESQTIDGTTYTFEITDVTTNGDGEAEGACFVSNVDFCELEVAVQAGGGPAFDKFVTVTPDADGEYCFDSSDLDRAISHFTIRCP